MMKNNRFFMVLAMMIFGSILFFQNTGVVSAKKYTIQEFSKEMVFQSGDEITIDLYRYAIPQSNGPIVTGERLYYKYFTLLLNQTTYKEFELSKENPTFTLPQIDNSDVEWKIYIEDSNIKKAPSGEGRAILNAVYHKPPKLVVKCDKDYIEGTDTTDCGIYFNTELPFKDISIKLNSDELEFSDEKPSKFFDLTKKDGLYHFEQSRKLGATKFEDEYNEDDNYYGLVMTFTASIKDHSASSLNISTEGSKVTFYNIEEHEYQEMMIPNQNHSIDTLKKEVPQEEVKGAEEIVPIPKENPETGIFNYLLLIIPIVLFGLSYLFVVRKNVFKFNK